MKIPPHWLLDWGGDSYSGAQAAHISKDSSSPQEPQSNENPDTNENEEDISHDSLGMDIHDFLPDSAEEIEQNAEPEIFSKFLIVDGKEFLETSIVAGLSSNRSKKVTMWTLQSGGMALHQENPNMLNNYLNKLKHT